MANQSELSKHFAGKTVLITGHTGFKGTWLTAWLLELGAKVVGFSNDVSTSPSHFDAAGFKSRIAHHVADIRDQESVKKVMLECQPDFVFHLAAQSLVRLSYAEPVATFQTNAMGTVHILDSLRLIDKPCTAVMVTSDKCYDNVEWTWGYRETDRLGGRDPYSASKGAAELVIRAYVESYFRRDSNVRIGVGRAGNVIGGGDWAVDRVVPDCVRAWTLSQSAIARNPGATRPWQHVLEPLSGYLALACALVNSPELHGEAFNFGPRAEQDHTVAELLDRLVGHWPGAVWQDGRQNVDVHREAGLLKLNCDKAMHCLMWRPTLDFDETARFTAEWYRTFYDCPGASVSKLTQNQIGFYVGRAKSRDLAWAQ